MRFRFKYTPSFDAGMSYIKARYHHRCKIPTPSYCHFLFLVKLAVIQHEGLVRKFLTSGSTFSVSAIRSSGALSIETKGMPVCRTRRQMLILFSRSFPTILRETR